MRTGIALLLVGLAAGQAGAPAVDPAFADLQAPSRNLLRLPELPISEPARGKPTPVVYSEKEFSEKFSGQVAQLVEGVELSDKFFGQETGSRVKKICIHSFYEAGTANYARPSSLMFRDDLLKLDLQFKVWAFHEYTHLIDDESGLTLSGGRMAELHKRITAANPEFFEKLAEKNFLPGVARLGHPLDDSKELVASLANSLNHPDIEGALVRAPRSFRLYYTEALEVLAEGLSRVKSVPSDAPIQGRIKHVLEFLANSEGRP
jgi:hypothetical protein